MITKFGPVRLRGCFAFVILSTCAEALLSPVILNTPFILVEQLLEPPEGSGETVAAGILPATLPWPPPR